VYEFLCRKVSKQIKFFENTAVIMLDSKRDLFARYGLHTNKKGKELAAKNCIHHKIHAK
jgi:hypothetical protein